MDLLCWCCFSPAWDDANADTTLSRKLVVVGDGACGKTSLLVRISRDVFQEAGYEPTFFEKDVVDVLYKNKKMEMVLQDCPGQETYERLRHVIYDEADVILLCFSLDNPDSLINVENTWIQEIRFYSPDVPIILVGCKQDLRDHDNRSQKYVTSKEAKAVAKRIQAKCYVECSAKDSTNCKKVLSDSVTQATIPKPSSSKSKK